MGVTTRGKAVKQPVAAAAATASSGSAPPTTGKKPGFHMEEYDTHGATSSEASDVESVASVYSGRSEPTPDEIEEESEISDFSEDEEELEEKPKKSQRTSGRRRGRGPSVVVIDVKPPRKQMKDEETFVPAPWLVEMRRKRYSPDPLHKALPEWVKLNRLRRRAKLREKRRTRLEWLQQHGTHYKYRRDSAAQRTRVGGRFSRDVPQFVPARVLVEQRRAEAKAAKAAGGGGDGGGGGGGGGGSSFGCSGFTLPVVKHEEELET